MGFFCIRSCRPEQSITVSFQIVLRLQAHVMSTVVRLTAFSAEGACKQALSHHWLLAEGVQVSFMYKCQILGSCGHKATLLARHLA